jgi:hypothetical protein
MISRAAGHDHGGDVAFERALFPTLAALVPLPSAESTFIWLKYPEGGIVSGKVYSDGSRLDGPSKLIARNGWAFVAVDSSGQITAAAHGVPPDWIDDIPGAEAWAVLQAASRAQPGTQYRVDCKPCVDAFHKGLAWATRDNRPLARVHRLMFMALDDTDAAAMVWMPAHTKETDVGQVSLGDGSLLTAVDRMANNEADMLAKTAVEAHRVPEQVRSQIKELDRLVEATARWVARATWAAGNQKVQPHRDTEASRAARTAAARAMKQEGTARPCKRVKMATLRPAALGGHTLWYNGGAWQCRTCKTKSRTYAKIAPNRCKGPAALLWSEKAQALAIQGNLEGGDMPGS